MYEVKAINYQQQHINKIDELNTLVKVLVERKEYAKLEKYLNEQLKSSQEINRLERERKTRMEELSESLEKEGIETEVVQRGI